MPLNAESKHGITRQAGFLSRAECSDLIEVYERYPGLRAPILDPMFAGRVLWTSSIPSAETVIHALLCQTRERARETIIACSSNYASLVDEDPQIVRWDVGPGMGLHADNEFADGRPNQTPGRLYAAIIYLNDSYVGGALCFQHLNLRLRPATGELVAFRGGRSHLHSVDPILKGKRYTMPIWYGSIHPERSQG